VRMYDTSNPYEWKYYKTVDYPFGQWTITDATLSPDNRFLVYSSIRSQAYLATTDPEDDSDPTVLDFSLPPGQRRRRSWGSSHFGVSAPKYHIQSFFGWTNILLFLDMVATILWRWARSRRRYIRRLCCRV